MRIVEQTNQRMVLAGVPGGFIWMIIVASSRFVPTQDASASAAHSQRRMNANPLYGWPAPSGRRSAPSTPNRLPNIDACKTDAK